MKIGILVPSRERLNLKLTLISSIITTVKDINNVVLYFGIDDDDPTKAITEKIVDAIPFVKLVPIHNNGKFIGINKIWNILAENCEEEIFGYIGDDMIFRTPDWDQKIIEKFEKECPDDKIMLCHCDDGYHKQNLCVNAFIHRRYKEVVGYMVREEFLINWSDRWLFQMFGAFNRRVFFPEVFIEHNHWVFGRRSQDTTSDRMKLADGNGISDKLWATLAPERRNELQKLSQYLKMTPNLDGVEL